MFLKFIFLSIICINLGLPLNNKYDLILIILAILVIISTSTNNIESILSKKKYILIILFITILNSFIPKFFFQEAHSVFLNNKDISVIEKILPKNIISKIKDDYYNNFDFKRLVNSSELSEEYFTNNKFITNPFSYSVDSFFQKNKYTRINSKINFSSREDLRIGKINSLTFNFPFDKHFRRILPYYIFFEIPKIAKNSQICFKGNIYFFYSNKALDLNNIKNSNFKKINHKDCIKFNNRFEYLYLVGYSINEKDNLEIKNYENLKIKFLKLIKYFFTLAIIFIFSVNFYKKNYFINSIIYTISSISTIILTLIRDPNLFFGLRYYRGGADGLVHYSRGRDILENLYNSDLLEALRGSADVFYYMPGLRYFTSFNNLIFGETTYAYLIACTFIPLLIYKIFEILLNKKIAMYALISFIFLPIFENMGFGHFNYVWQFARHHAESLAILFFLYAFYFIILFEKKPNKKNSNLYFIGIALSALVFLRPNFFPTSFFLFLHAVILFFYHKKYPLILSLLIGYSFIFTCLLHNYYFGNSYAFFTNAEINFTLTIKTLLDAIISFLSLDFANSNYLILKSQFIDWNPLYNLHRLLILLFITFIIILKKQKIILYTLFISMIAQHGVLILTHAGSRYAYLAWLLTFIIFINLLMQIKFKKK